jgi:hypothetical protein
MSFNTNRFTEKSIEAINASQNLAERNGNSQVEPEHLLLALIEQSDGVVPQVLSKMNVAIGALAQQVRAELGKLPRVSGSGVQVGISNRLRTVLVKAHDELTQFGDEYVSTEHLLLAILAHAGGATQRLMQQHGITRDNLLMRLMDAMFAFPPLILAIAVVTCVEGLLPWTDCPLWAAGCHILVASKTMFTCQRARQKSGLHQPAFVSELPPSSPWRVMVRRTCDNMRVPESS